MGGVNFLRAGAQQAGARQQLPVPRRKLLNSLPPQAKIRRTHNDPMTPEVALERPLPHNLDAERSILGAILLDNHALNAAVEKLQSEDFFLDQHRRVFQQMIALGESQQAIDLVTLAWSSSVAGSSRPPAAPPTWRNWWMGCHALPTSTITRA